MRRLLQRQAPVFFRRCISNQKPEDGRGDPREAAGQIAAISAVDRRGGTRFVKLHPPAIDFSSNNQHSPVGSENRSLVRAGGMN
jgi:hypothetical protein